RPESPKMSSSPASPLQVSLPAPPAMVSSPPRPRRLSLPMPPLRSSSPSPPSTRSLPLPALTVTPIRLPEVSRMSEPIRMSSLPPSELTTIAFTPMNTAFLATPGTPRTVTLPGVEPAEMTILSAFSLPVIRRTPSRSTSAASICRRSSDSADRSRGVRRTCRRTARRAKRPKNEETRSSRWLPWLMAASFQRHRPPAPPDRAADG
ncbi:hypothetical protein EBR04_10155, partial [bacterium]|nr:hypothetical protein [bacterium]